MLHSYSSTELAPDRDAVILELCRGKRVLHIGAADSPYTREKLEEGLLLHAALAKVAGSLRGIDLDSEAIDYLRTKGIEDILCADLAGLETVPIRPEVIVMGETIEHLPNPAQSLDRLRNLMDEETRLVISTPNLVSLYNQFQVLRNRETQHPDHRIGFTLGLIEQLLDSCHLRVERAWFTFLNRSRVDWKEKVWRSLARWRPGLAETLLVACARKGPGA